ncbi:uncharacterized protein LOC143884566 isoform X2 [Tasmannia lanceolata]|uniref:uncharacterized protein LOC143884566 isoform X2 n=1 Tax=Tasmannia lanceolata TaxID=3420 RepID=UPI00406390D1
MADFHHPVLTKSSSATLSKKISNANGFTDVFGGPPKFSVSSFSSRLETYREIFGNFFAPKCSSIPILDFPVLDCDDVPVDVQSSSFDYSEVFGGFDGGDFAISYEEMFAKPKESENHSVWTAAETVSSGQAPETTSRINPEECNVDPFADSEKLSNGASDHLYDGVKQFNMSYNKTNQSGKEDSINGTIHIAQLDEVSGYTFVVDSNSPSQRTKCDKSPPQVANDLNLNVDCKSEMMEGKNFRETTLQASVSSSITNTYGNDPKADKKHLDSTCTASKDAPASYQHHLYNSGNHISSCGAYPGEVFLTVSEISLKTHPSRVPPPSRPPPELVIKEGESRRTMATKPKAYPDEVHLGRPLSPNQTYHVGVVSETYALEEDSKDGSPPFFDVEVDASSAAAASAAAMKEAMEKAQVRLKSAKESMERKRDKESYQSHMKLGMTCEKKSKEKRERIIAQEDYKFKAHVAEAACERENGEVKYFYGDEGLKSMGAAHVAPHFEHKRGHSELSDESIAVWQVKEERADDWKPEKQSYDLVKNDKVKLVQEVPEWENSEKKLKEAGKVHGFEQNEKKAANQVADLVNNDKSSASIETHEHEELDKKLIAAHEQEENVKKLKAAQEAREREEFEKRLKAVQEAHEREEFEKRLKAAQETHEREEFEKRLKAAQEAREREEFEKRLKAAQEAREREENDKRLKAAQEARELEENDKRVKPAQEAREREENEKRVKAAQEAREREENEKRVKAAQEAREREEEQRLNAAIKANECEKYDKKLEADKEAFEPVVNEMKLKAAQEAHEHEQNESKLKAAFDHEEVEWRSKAGNEACEDEVQNKELKTAQEACVQEEKQKKLKLAREGTNCENEKKSKVVKEARQCEDTEKEPTLAKVAHERDKTEKKLKEEWVEDNKKLKAAQDANELEERMKTMKSANETFEREVEEKKSNVAKVAYEQDEIEFKLKAAEEAHNWEETDKNLNGAHDARRHENNETKMKTTREVLLPDGVWEKLREAYVASSESEKIEKKMKVDNEGPELVENEKNIRETQVTLDREESKKKFNSAREVFQLGERGKKLEAAQHANAIDDKEKVLRTAPVVTMGPDVLRNEKKSDEMREIEEREKEGRVQKEKDRERERLRKIEEERERKREREKDRLSVERATHEAQNRAFVEAREKAERIAVESVTAEARQRALAEAREKAEKASAEAREKSLAERASIEARLRAERAAVERATTEARERAVERVMAEKAAAEARERAERSVAEKFAAASREWRRKDSEMEDSVGLGANTVIGMRQNHSFPDVRDFDHDPQIQASYFNEKSQGADGESAIRYKARLQRYQRTAERAAKALAEKNLRDIFALREQTERNRLAETLDAEIKRWSNGKEGNIRALLSTLQYILGPESGWHPIPLTDVITAVAVKKAYRKATLCVHPDKLQQRGASIHQKYICEKVFDLLKDAWNRFNSEVR